MSTSTRLEIRALKSAFGIHQLPRANTMWNQVRNLDGSFLSGIDVILKTLDAADKMDIPDFRDDSGLFIASDCSPRL
jgi:hypothetical protein